MLLNRNRIVVSIFILLLFILISCDSQKHVHIPAGLGLPEGLFLGQDLVVASEIGWNADELLQGKVDGNCSDFEMYKTLSLSGNERWSNLDTDALTGLFLRGPGEDCLHEGTDKARKILDVLIMTFGSNYKRVTYEWDRDRSDYSWLWENDSCMVNLFYFQVRDSITLEVDSTLYDYCLRIDRKLDDELLFPISIDDRKDPLL